MENGGTCCDIVTLTFREYVVDMLVGQRLELETVRLIAQLNAKRFPDVPDIVALLVNQIAVEVLGA
jgi:hypothetical protein